MFNTDICCPFGRYGELLRTDSGALVYVLFEVKDSLSGTGTALFSTFAPLKKRDEPVPAAFEAQRDIGLEILREEVNT